MFNMDSDIQTRIQKLREERKAWLDSTGVSIHVQPGNEPPLASILHTPAKPPNSAVPMAPLKAPPSSVEEEKNSRLRMTGYTHPRDFNELRIAGIMDEFTTRCYASECRIITFRPDNAREVIKETRPHFLFVESAWNGNGGSWQYRVAKYNRKSEDLAQLLDWCRQEGLPTVFWNKEDPFHFDRFIENARRFDYIFTTDINMVPRYREVSGHDHVYVLPFSAQPAFHNPIRLVEDRLNKLCFAGSYYGDRHDTRRAAMETMLDAAIPYGLDIFDRNAGKNMPIFEFPERFQPFIRGSLAYDEIERAYKGYRCLLNVNTIQDSATMFSRRVFEILASGTPVISNPAQGLTETFGPDLVQIADSLEGYSTCIERLMQNDAEFRRLQLQGIRAVMRAHTYRHRLHSVLEILGLPIPDEPRNVYVIGFPRTTEEVDAITQSFEQQTYKHKHLILFGNPDAMDAQTPNLIDPNKIVQCPRLHEALSLSACVKNAPAESNSLTIHPTGLAGFSPRHYYGPNYLLDLMDAMTYSRADVVGKGCFYEARQGHSVLSGEPIEFAYTESLRADAALFRLEAFAGQSAQQALDFLKQGEDTRMLSRSGRRVFSADRMNFLRNFAGIGTNLAHEIEKVRC